jgi:succinate dehydrogenase/fumarate reductase cytochrome b subunit (b558 family)
MTAQLTKESTPEDAAIRRDRRHFILRRLHSLTGIVPVGLFLAEHLWTNAKAMQGQTCFGNAVNEIIHLPFLPAIEIFGIFLPLAFHSLYGVKLAFESKQNVGAYGYSRNWMFFLQRVTGIITLVFIIFHLKDFRIAKLLNQMSHEMFFKELGDQLSHTTGRMPLNALFYTLGVTASVFHFANGIRTFVFSWGITISEKSQRYAAWAAAAIGVALWFIGTNTVLYFATGGQSFIPSSLVRGPGGRDLCEETMVPTQQAPAQPAATVPAQPGAVAPPGAAAAPH